MDASGNHRAPFAQGNTLSLTFGGNVCHVFGADGSNLEF